MNLKTNLKPEFIDYITNTISKPINVDIIYDTINDIESSGLSGKQFTNDVLRRLKLPKNAYGSIILPVSDKNYNIRLKFNTSTHKTSIILPTLATGHNWKDFFTLKFDQTYYKDFDGEKLGLAPRKFKYLVGDTYHVFLVNFNIDSFYTYSLTKDVINELNKNLSVYFICKIISPSYLKTSSYKGNQGKVASLEKFGVSKEIRAHILSLYLQGIILSNGHNIKILYPIK